MLEEQFDNAEPRLVIKLNSPEFGQVDSEFEFKLGPEFAAEVDTELEWPEPPDTLSGVESLGGVGGKLNMCGLEWEDAEGPWWTPMLGGLVWCEDGLLGNGVHQVAPAWCIEWGIIEGFASAGDVHGWKWGRQTWLRAEI